MRARAGGGAKVAPMRLKDKRQFLTSQLGLTSQSLGLAMLEHRAAACREGLGSFAIGMAVPMSSM